MATRARTRISLAQIHNVVGGELVGSPQATVTSLASFEEAGPNELTFVTGDRMLKTSGPITAGALLAHRHLAEIANPHIVVANPTLAFAQVAQAFFCPVALLAELMRQWSVASTLRSVPMSRSGRGSRWETESRLARE